MKKRIIATLFGVLLTGALFAQQNWTLEQCIEYAVTNNLTIKSGEMTQSYQQIKLEQAKNQILPSVSASFSPSLNFGTGLNDSNLYVPQNSQSANIGISANMVLFNGFRIKNSVEAQRFSMLASEQDLKKAKESLAVSIASAYLQVLFNRELYQIALEQVKLSQEQLDMAKTKAALGKIPEGQVYENEAQLAKDKYNATESKSSMDLALLELAQLLELKDWKSFSITEPVVDMNALRLQIWPAEEVYAYATQNKSDVKASEYRVKGSEMNLKVSQGAYYPTVYLGVDYGTRWFSTSQLDLAQQLDRNGGAGIGLSVNIPIFNRLDTKNNVRLSKIDLERARLELESTKKTLFTEIQKAWFNATKAAEKYASSQDAVTNSVEALRFAEEKYKNERATLYEYNQARLNLVTAQSNQLQAKYNYLFCVKILDFYKGEPLKL